MANLSAEQLLIKHEGYRATPYDDGRGNLTVAIGFNLDAPDAWLICSRHGLDYDQVRSGQQPVSLEMAMAILRDFIAHAQAGVEGLIPDFSRLPGLAQAVVLDMLVNLGMEKFSEFHALRAALAAGNLTLAAQAMKASKWFIEVGTRGTDNVTLMLEAANAPATVAGQAMELLAPRKPQP